MASPSERDRMYENGGFRSADVGDSGSSRTARLLKKKAVRSFETSGINTPAATLRWIYFYSDRAVRNTGFSNQDQKQLKIRKKSEKFSELFVCKSPGLVTSGPRR